MISRTATFWGQLFVCAALLTIFSVSTVASETPRYFENSFISFGNVGDFEDEIFDLVNRERKKGRLSELEFDERLGRVARRYSRQMARGGFFSHYDPEGNSVVERVTDEKVAEWGKIGENLFFCEGYDDVAAAAVKGWLKSPSHRRNILDGVYTHTGIGVAETGSGGFYVTQVFLRP
ncbi:MAG: CAP domain-containing protein [Acidobacteria bacterium]|nr:CAP domain-containing protein [Acidobacteriota bacterium]